MGLTDENGREENKVKTRIIYLSLAVLLLSGCDAVFTSQPLGDEVVVLDRAQWQGTWLAADMVIVTTVLDSEKGQLQAAWLERDENGASMEAVSGLVRSTDEIYYFNIEDQNENEKRRYHWMRVAPAEGRMTIWGPSLERFEVAVASGKIPGLKTEDGVVLGELGDGHMEMINDVSMGLLSWEDPAMMMRIGD
jgi:hypothetical protein